MNTKLEEIKETLSAAPKKRCPSLYAGLIAVILLIGVFFIFKPLNFQYSCRISEFQKQQLITKMDEIAKTGNISRYLLFRHLKKQFKYETISKMPCHHFKSALNFLDEYERRIKSEQ